MEFQCALVVGQCRKIWLVFSSSLRQRWHQKGLWKDLFIRFDPVGILSNKMFHISKWLQGADLSFQSNLQFKFMFGGLNHSISLIYPAFGEYVPCLAKAHIISSGPLEIWMWAYVRASMYSYQSGRHYIGMSRSRADFHACCRKEEFLLSPMCLMWVIPLLRKCLIKSASILCASPQPTHASVPIWIEFPCFSLHVMPSQRSGNALITTFHTLEMLLPVLGCCLN